MRFEDLKFVRLTNPELFRNIPPNLFEQMKGSTFNVEKLYQYGPNLLMSPLTFFYVLVEDGVIKGILWAEINPLDNRLNVHTFSVDKKYQNANCHALKIALDFLRSIQKEYNLERKIEILTTRPRAYERAGWIRSEKTLMEV